MDGNHKIRYIVFVSQKLAGSELWDYNSRPKKLTIQVGETQKDVEVFRRKKKFCLSFDEPGERILCFSVCLNPVYRAPDGRIPVFQIELYE